MKLRIFLLSALLFMASIAVAKEPVKIGIIGLDTSHAAAFAKLINGTPAPDWASDFRIVAAYPHGSKTIKSSYERIPRFTKAVEKYGVKVVGSIAELLEQVDCVLLETNDGRLHLEQAVEVFKAGKRCFIDKPIGATLADAIAIYEMAERYNIPIFSTDRKSVV